MSFFSKLRRFLNLSVVVGDVVNNAVLVRDSGPIDQAFNRLVKAVVKNSRGLSRTRILAAVETLRSAVKDTPAESAR